MQSKISNCAQVSANEKTQSAVKLANFKRVVLTSGLPLPWGPVAWKRLLRTVLIYACVFLLAFFLQQYAESQRLHAFATGLMLPGAGFLYWASPMGDAFLIYFALAAVSVAGYVVAIVLWSATGNMAAPIIMWLLAALAAAWVPSALPVSEAGVPWPMAVAVLRIGVPLMILIGMVLCAEGLNTAVESACNAVSVEYCEHIKTAKDVAAGAVLLISLTAAAIGVQTLFPYVKQSIWPVADPLPLNDGAQTFHSSSYLSIAEVGV